MSIHLAMAIATDAPLLGLKMRRDKMETALSLKLVHSEDGAVQALERAIAKAYAAMPSVPRSDLVAT